MWNIHKENIVIPIEVNVAPAPRRIPATTISMAKKPNVMAVMRRKWAPEAITSGSFGIKSPMMGLANIKNTIPIPVKNKKANQRLILVACFARLIFLAPRFCPTTAEMAMEIPMAGIIKKLESLFLIP